MASGIEKREARLLRWERYLRRTRHVAFGLCILMVLVGVVAPAVGFFPEDGDARIEWWVIAFFFAWGYESHLRVRHIESIKFHRAAEAADGAGGLPASGDVSER